jgi:hypothetical protein
MKKHIYEKTQKKNPHKLTVKQHVFSSASIARFCNIDGRVSLHDKLRNKVRFAKQHDDIFCAMRAWDQRAESGYMKSIEDEFQALALKIIDGTVFEIRNVELNTINYFYALWYMRARYKILAVNEVQMNGVTGDNLSQDQEEVFERNYVGYIRADGKVPARQINGLQLQSRIDGFAYDLSSAQWGVIQAQEGEFIVPDIPTHTIVPLTPTLCLISPSGHGTIIKGDVAEINDAVVNSSCEYFFARDLSNCPRKDGGLVLA